MAETRVIFADGLMDANVNYGVARMTLAQTGPDGKPIPVGQLVMPLVQLPAFANGLHGLLKQIETRMKEAQASAKGPGATAGNETVAGATPGGTTVATEVPAASIPGSFRFG